MKKLKIVLSVLVLICFSTPSFAQVYIDLVTPIESVREAALLEIEAAGFAGASFAEHFDTHCELFDVFSSFSAVCVFGDESDGNQVLSGAMIVSDSAVWALILVLYDGEISRSRFESVQQAGSLVQAIVANPEPGKYLVYFAAGDGENVEDKMAVIHILRE